MMKFVPLDTIFPPYRDGPRTGEALIERLKDYFNSNPGAEMSLGTHDTSSLVKGE